MPTKHNHQRVEPQVARQSSTEDRVYDHAQLQANLS